VKQRTSGQGWSLTDGYLTGAVDATARSFRYSDAFYTLQNDLTGVFEQGDTTHTVVFGVDYARAKAGRDRQRDTLKTGPSQSYNLFADAMLPKLLTPETVSKRPEIVKFVRDMMLQTKPEGAAAALRGMAEREDQTELLAKISVPTLIVVGSEDAITPVADSEKMHHAIDSSRLVVLDHAGHVSNVERAQQFNDEVLHFLSQS